MWPFVEVLRRTHVPLERMCELTGITPAQLRDPEFRFTQATVNRIVALAFDVVGPSAAVAAALTVEAGHFQLLELIARSAPKVGDGLEQVCRFFPLLHDGGHLHHELGADGDHTLRWAPPTGYEVHHGCLEPLRGRSIQVFVSGTRLVEASERGTARVVAVAARHGGEQSLVGVVGEGAAHDPAIRARLLSSLMAAGARSDLVARPSGRSGLSCRVHPDDVAPALRVLHEHFFTPPERSQP